MNKTNNIFLTLLSLTILGCSHYKNDNSKNSLNKFEYFDTYLANNENYDIIFYPRRIIQTDSKDSLSMDSTMNSGFSYYLTAFKEDSLKNDNDTVIRFLWLRTFNKPVLIKARKTKSAYEVITKICSGAGGYSSGTIEYYSKITINDSVWKTLFNKQLDKLLLQKSVENEKDGSDGSLWLIEFNLEGKYYLRERCSPQFYARGRDTIDLKIFENYCMKLIDLANYPLDKELKPVY